MPDAFDAALAHLHQSLSSMAEQGMRVRASRASLEALVQAAGQGIGGTAPVIAAPEEPRPSAAPASKPVREIKPPAPELTVRAETEVAPKPEPAPRKTAREDTFSAPQPRLQPPDDPRPKVEQLADLRERILGCDLCPNLVSSRTQVVFGVGNPEAELMFVGEAPGEDEDLQGEPFVGKAGQLLTRIIETMGLSRDTVYIANVLKCRPDMPAGSTGNRKPNSTEMSTCLPYLERQIAIIQPKVLVALGATAMEGLLGETSPMARLRGRWHDFRGIPLMATYHPAYLLRNQSMSEKRKVWEDMLLVMERLGLPISAKQRGYFLSK